MDVAYTPTFLRLLKSLPEDLQEGVMEKVVWFKDRRMHKALKIHKLKGRLAGRWSFSVNYRTRIVFLFSTPNRAIFLAVGDHDVYR